MLTLAGTLQPGAILRPPSSVTPPPDPGLLRLIRLSSKQFPDNATPDQNLATIQFAPAGSEITVVTEDAVPDAFVAIGNQIRPGAGYGAIPCGPVVLWTFVTFDGVTKLTVHEVDKYSAGATSLPACTTEVELDRALEDAATALGEPNTKFVIELDRAVGVEWDPNRLIDMRVAAGSQLILRGAGGLNPAQRQKLNRVQMNVRGGHGIYVQNIDRICRMNTAEWQSGVSRSTTRYVGDATNTGPYRYYRSNCKGGVLTYAGIDPDQSYTATKPTADWIEELFFFNAIYPNSSTGGPMTLGVYDPRTQTNSQTFNAASGTGLKILSTPGFVGTNLPGGVLPSMTGWPAAGGVPLIFKKQPWWNGIEAAARFKAEFLPANDPRAYAGAGNYVTEVVIDNYGDGYSARKNVSDTNISGEFYANQNCAWATDPTDPTNRSSARSLRSLANGETAASSTISPSIEWSECRFEDLAATILVPVLRGDVRRAVYRCFFDRYTLDVMAWGTSSDLAFEQDWGPTSPKIRIWQCIFGRCLSTPADRTDPHVDILQLFCQGVGDIRWWVDWIMNICDAGLGTRGAPQVYFGTDSNTSPSGQRGDVFDGFFFGHMQRGGLKSYASTWLSAVRMHRFLALGGSFDVATRGFRSDKLGSHAYFSKVLYAAGRLPLSQQFLAEDVRLVTQSSFAARNTHAFVDTIEKAIETFTPSVGSPDHGDTPVDNMEQELDWLGGGHDPDAVPVAFPYAQRVGAAQNAIVTFAPRQLTYGVRPKAFAPEPGTEWQVGGPPNLNGDLTNASAWMSMPGVIEPGQYFRPRRVTGSGIMQLASARFAIAGKQSEARAFTSDRATQPIVADASTGSFMRSSNASSINISPNVHRRIVFFGNLRAPFPNPSIGTLTLLKGSTTTSTAPFWLYLFSNGRLRLRGGASNELNISYDPADAVIAGGDVNFFMAVNYNIEARPADPITGSIPLPTEAPEPGVIQPYMNFRPMQMLATGGFTDPLADNIPLRMGANPTLFANEAGSERPIGWGLYHLGIWSDDGTGPLPDFSQWDVQRAFTREFIDGLNPSDPGNYPGRGIIDVLGPGLRLLVRGNLAAANGAGLVNLAPSSKAFAGGGMSPFVNQGAPWTDIILPTEPTFPAFTTWTGPEPALIRSNAAGAEETTWAATSALTLAPGQRLVTGVASDSATNTLSINPGSAGPWVRVGGAAGGDSSLDLFTCLNETDENITVQLVVDSSAPERMCSLTYRALPQTFGGRIMMAQAFSNSPSNPPAVNLGVTRKAECIVMRSRAGTDAFATTTPAGYGLEVQAAVNPSQNTGARLSGAQRQFEAASEDPGAWPEAHPGGNCSIILWEELA